MDKWKKIEISGAIILGIISILVSICVGYTGNKINKESIELNKISENINIEIDKLNKLSDRLEKSEIFQEEYKRAVTGMKELIVISRHVIDENDAEGIKNFQSKMIEFFKEGNYQEVAAAYGDSELIDAVVYYGEYIEKFLSSSLKEMNNLDFVILHANMLGKLKKSYLNIETDSFTMLKLYMGDEQYKRDFNIIKERTDYLLKNK